MERPIKVDVVENSDYKGWCFEDENSLRAKNIFACMSFHFFMLKMHLVFDMLKVFH